MVCVSCSLHVRTSTVEHATLFQCNVQRRFFSKSMDSDSELKCSHKVMEAALPDLDGLRSDDANLEVAVAAGSAGIVDGASVLAPVARPQLNDFLLSC